MNSPLSPPPLSLDDVASLLIQVEAANRDGINQLYAALSTTTAADLAAAGIIAKVVRQLKYALDYPSDAATALQFAGEIISETMDARDSAGRSETPRDIARETGDTNTLAFDVQAAAVASQVPHASQTAADILPIDTDLGLLQDFLAESRDDLRNAEAALLILEHDPANDEAINCVFRAFHTFKGTSAFLGLTHITNFAHQAESLLSAVRDHTIPFSRTCANLAFRASDMLEALIVAVENAMPGEPLVAPPGYGVLLQALADVEASGGIGDLTVLDVTASRITAPDAAPPIPSSVPSSAAASHTATDTSIRIRTERLDLLIDMVGELVIAQAMLAQDPTVVHGGVQDLTRKVTHTGKIVRELQDLSMSMRMVPLKATFQKMVRLSRDAAQRSGKQVELTLEGEDTEIDRNMVDMIGDPLIHMVRNAVDHGIETPDVRAAHGKAPVGHLRLAAYHAGGNVMVELHDDGKGLDRDRIVRKAIQLGLIDTDKGMTDADVYRLIFAPGFSTSEAVTSLSGRGVGMDVVRRNIESLHGRIDISSEPDHGTRFSVRLPLTLAITDGMCVRVGGERYIIPTIHIQLSFRPTEDAIFTVAGRGEMVLLRGDLMPLIRLHHLFSTEGAIHDPTKALIVVANVGDQRVALLVDELLGQQQVVAKPLGDGIGRISGVSGGAILGDGRVGLILDVPELAQLAKGEPSPVRSVA